MPPDTSPLSTCAGCNPDPHPLRRSHHMFEKYACQITGVAPLILYNGHLADPLNYYAKEMKKISGKRHKTEADLEELAPLEWHGSLYVSEGQVVIPGEVI